MTEPFTLEITQALVRQKFWKQQDAQNLLFWAFSGAHPKDRWSIPCKFGLNRLHVLKKGFAKSIAVTRRAKALTGHMQNDRPPFGRPVPGLRAEILWAARPVPTLLAIAKYSKHNCLPWTIAPGTTQHSFLKWPWRFPRHLNLLPRHGTGKTLLRPRQKSSRQKPLPFVKTGCLHCLATDSWLRESILSTHPRFRYSRCVVKDYGAMLIYLVHTVNMRFLRAL